MQINLALNIFQICSLIGTKKCRGYRAGISAKWRSAAECFVGFSCWPTESDQGVVEICGWTDFVDCQSVNDRTRSWTKLSRVGNFNECIQACVQISCQVSQKEPCIMLWYVVTRSLAVEQSQSAHIQWSSSTQAFLQHFTLWLSIYDWLAIQIQIAGGFRCSPEVSKLCHVWQRSSEYLKWKLNWSQVKVVECKL